MKSDQYINKVLYDLLNEVKTNEEYKNYSFDINTVYTFISDLYKGREEFEVLADSNYNKDFFVSYLFMLFTTNLCILFNPKGKKSKILPEDWLQEDVANFIMHCLLIQITNYILSVIYLTRSGNDPIARVTLRALYEICWLTVVVLADREKMKLYTKTGMEDKESQAIWYKNFTPEKLKKDLRKIDNIILKDSSMNEFLINERDSTYRFYSGYAHNSFANVLASSHIYDNDLDTIPSRLFGNFSIGTQKTINQMNYILFHFSNSIIATIIKIHNYSIPKRNKTWKNTIFIKEFATRLFISLSE